MPLPLGRHQSFRQSLLDDPHASLPRAIRVGAGIWLERVIGAENVRTAASFRQGDFIVN